MNWKLLAPPYSLSTIAGLAVIGGSISGVLLEQMTVKQAVAACVSGLIGVLLKQATGSALVTGANPSVVASDATVNASAGSTTTIKG